MKNARTVTLLAALLLATTLPALASSNPVVPVRSLVFEVTSDGSARLFSQRLVSMTHPPRRVAASRNAVLLVARDANASEIFETNILPAEVSAEFGGPLPPQSAFLSAYVPVATSTVHLSGQLLNQDADIVLTADSRLASENVTASPLVAAENKLNILILGDGYTAAEQATFEQNADNFARKLIEVEPYATYAGFFNIQKYFVASAQSGADHPPYSAQCTANSSSCCPDLASQGDAKAGFRNTVFDAAYCVGGSFRRLSPNYGKVSTAAGTIMPGDNKIVFLLVNDNEYGGSGGTIPTASVHFYGIAIAVHEFAHTFTNLADEYIDPAQTIGACSDRAGSTKPCEANATDETNVTNVKWKSWVHINGIGLFQGARYSNNYYRPASTCRMKEIPTSQSLPFCSICTQEFVRRLYQFGIKPVEKGQELPPAGQVSMETGSSLVFRVFPLGPTIFSKWSVNGSVVQESVTPTYTFTPTTPGRYRIRVDNKDETNLVLDPIPEMSVATEWTVLVTTKAIADATSGAQGEPQVATSSLLLPQGTATVTLTYAMTTQEFAGRCPTAQGCGDPWGVTVAPVPVGLTTLSDTPLFDKQGIATSGNEVNTVALNVGGLTASGDTTLRLRVSATNMGDANAPTTVHATLSVPITDACIPQCDPCSATPPPAECNLPAIAIDSIRPAPLALDRTEGDSTYFSVERTGLNHYKRAMAVKVSPPPPPTATVRVIVNLLRADGTFLMEAQNEVADPYSYVVRAEKAPGEYTVAVTQHHDRTRLVTDPPPAHETKYEFRVIVSYLSKSVEATREIDTLTAGDPPTNTPLPRPIHALWRMPQSIPRYAPQTGDREAGGDDWTSAATYRWIDEHRNLLTAIDDISFEHAINDGHPGSHQYGTDFLMFPFYQFPNVDKKRKDEYTALRVYTGRAFETTPQGRDALTQVQQWVRATRAGLDNLLALDTVQQIRYADGQLCPNNTDSSLFFRDDLPDGWARDLLRTGVITDRKGRILDLGNEFHGWQNSDATKMAYTCEQNFELDVSLNRCKLSELPPPCSNTRNGIPPQIGRNPQSTTIDRGQSVSLTVMASGDDLAYQWFEGARGDLSRPVTNGRSASLTVTPPETRAYWVFVFNAWGNVQSTTASVTVRPPCIPVVITSQSESSTITAGTTVTLNATVSGGTPQTFQWYEGTAPDRTHALRNETASSLNVRPSTTTSYWVFVQNNCGNASSATITVTVACTPPTITTHPADMTVVVGTTVMLTAVVEGSAPITVQWYKGFLNDTSTPAATGTTLTVVPTSTSNYWARATNACGTTTTRLATVTVTNACTPPAITSEPIGTTIYPGETARLSADAFGTNLSAQWYEGATGDRRLAIANATVYAVDVAPQRSTQYWVEFTNSCGTAASATVLVVVDCNPTIYHQPQSTSIAAGGSATLEVIAAIGGSSALSYQWYERAAGASTWELMLGAADQQLTVTPTTSSAYYVEVRTSCGATTSAIAEVTVVPNCTSPIITQNLPDGIGDPGAVITLTVGASGTEPLAYQWYKSLVEVTFWGPIAGATSPTLDVTVRAQYTDYYRVEVTNACGQASSSTTVHTGGISAAAYALEGTLAIAPNGTWSVDGTTLQITNETKLKGHPTHGDHVKVLGSKATGRFAALWIEKRR